MSIAAQFMMYPYIASSKAFQTPNKEEKLFDRSLKNEIFNKYKTKIQGISKQEAKKLQDALNGAIKNQSENYQKLINNFIDELDTGLLRELQKLNSSAGNVVTMKGASFSLSKVSAYEEKIREIAQRALGDKVKVEDSLSTVISRLNGQLNTLRGDIFENILAYVLDDSVTILNGKIEQGEKELLQNFERNIMKNFEKLSYNSTKVSGAELKDSISITIGDKGYTISGSKGKTDVTISSLGGQFNTGISAKSYTSSRRIHLVSQANLAGLIAQWPIEEEQKNLALNAFTSKDQIGAQYNLSKSIFLLQALMGTEEDNLLSELFIINRNTQEDPFIVLSTADLIFNKSFAGKFSPIHALASPREEIDFYNFVKSTVISISTNQTISKLASKYITKD